MGHLTAKDAYKSLEERINWFTQGAPPSETFYKILAGTVLRKRKPGSWRFFLSGRLPVKTGAQGSGIPSRRRRRRCLDQLCEKALLVDSEHEGVRKFVMPPPMAGFIEFALMRTRGDIDQKYLKRTLLPVHERGGGFRQRPFLGHGDEAWAASTSRSRCSPTEQTNHILDYERASHIVEEADYIGLGLCYCRHKAYHAGHPCEIDAPWDVCLTFGNVARSLAEHGGHAKSHFQGGGHGRAGAFLCGKPGADRREREGEPGFYLQLLRLLL